MSPLEMLVARLEIPVAEEGAFVFCPACQDVHRVSKADRAPVYGLDGSSQAADDFQAFLARHVDHELCVLRRSTDAEVHSHARHDPMCRILWEAVDDGGNRYVISLGREDVESPRRYGIMPGRLEVVSESIGLDEELLRAVLDEALYPGPAPASRLDRLIEACRRAITTLPWDAFDPVDEARDDPGIQLACLPRAVLQAIAAEATRVFPGNDGERVLELLERELRDEIPVVRLLRRYVVAPRGGSPSSLK